MLTSPDRFVSAMCASDEDRAEHMTNYCNITQLAFKDLSCAMDQSTIRKLNGLLTKCQTITALDFTGEIMTPAVKLMAGDLLLSITQWRSTIHTVTTDQFTMNKGSPCIQVSDRGLSDEGFYGIVYYITTICNALLHTIDVTLVGGCLAACRYLL